jgi:predicted nuclease with TOPRIM domain
MLTQSINVLTEEKAKTEFSFQQDKKNLLIKLEAANIQLMEQSKKFTEETIKLQEQYEELKNKLEVEKKAKIDEESVHEEMMKELQHCLNLEKEKYETLHQQVIVHHTSILLLYFSLKNQS